MRESVARRLRRGLLRTRAIMYRVQLSVETAIITSRTFYSRYTASHGDKGRLRIDGTPLVVIRRGNTTGLLTVGSIIEIYWRHYECV